MDGQKMRQFSYKQLDSHDDYQGLSFGAFEAFGVCSNGSDREVFSYPLSHLEISPSNQSSNCPPSILNHL